MMESKRTLKLEIYLDMKHSGVILLMLLLFLSCQDQSTTLYLVRHAEKEENNTMQNQNEDPPLTLEGEQRAEKLKKLLADVSIDAVYSTSYQRNMNTVEPLAIDKNLSIQNYEWHQWSPMIEEILVSYQGKTVVICGHGDNLLPMIEYLDGKRPQESLGTHEYDKIFKVERQGDTALVEVIEY